MALTPMRWIAAAIAGCLALGALVLGSGGEHKRVVDEGWEVSKVLDRHGNHASTAARQLRTVALLDSIGVSARNPRDAEQVGAVRIIRDAALPAMLADSMTALARRAARQVPESGGSGTDVVLVYDTVSQIHGAAMRRLATQVDYVLPRSAGERCIALVHVGVDAAAKTQIARLPTDAAAQRVLGPCAYYQAFGLPGRAVDAWLRRRGWAFAGDGSWQQATPSANLLYAGFNGGQSGVERIAIGQTTLPYLYGMQLEGAQCAAGDIEACDRTLLERERIRRQPSTLNDSILFNSFTAITFSQEWYPRRALGEREPSLLADMVRTLGRDRFARFWTSNEAVPAAFAHAAGEPIEQWTSRWATTTYGAVPPRGARPTIAIVLVCLVLIALTLLTGVVVSERRQFA